MPVAVDGMPVAVHGMEFAMVAVGKGCEVVEDGLGIERGFWIQIAEENQGVISVMMGY